jgi:uridine kinase
MRTESVRTSALSDQIVTANSSPKTRGPASALAKVVVIDNRYFDRARLEHLVAQLHEACAVGPDIIIGIGGFGGSGKSTLARILQERLPISSVLTGDDFYRPDLGHADLVRLRQEVLEPLRTGRAARDQRFDWGTSRLTDCLDVDGSGAVIVEGVIVLSPELMDYFDFTIWVDCPQDAAAHRGIARDLSELWCRYERGPAKGLDSARTRLRGEVSSDRHRGLRHRDHHPQSG